jgi:hypothetical protein
MPSQWRNDQKGGGQATGRKAPSIPNRMANGPKQTDNGTGAGTKVPPLKPVPGDR